MLFISRKNLDALAAALDVAIIEARDSQGLRVNIGPTDSTLEIAALNAMSVAVSMTLGRPDSVHPADVSEAVAGPDGIVSFLTPPKLD